MPFAVCIYCGSRMGSRPCYRADAEHLGQLLATHGFRLVYGGGNVGLMGVLAHSALNAGGEVIGVIPQALLDIEVGLRDATELIVTDTLRTRKGIMDDRADAFVAMPGGYGTLEELMEVLTLRQLRYHDKPIILLNSDGFYDPLITLFEHFHREQFIAERQLALFEVASSPDDVIARLEHYAREKTNA